MVVCGRGKAVEAAVHSASMGVRPAGGRGSARRAGPTCR
jgi:hypothetical protein